MCTQIWWNLMKIRRFLNIEFIEYPDPTLQSRRMRSFHLRRRTAEYGNHLPAHG